MTQLAAAQKCMKNTESKPKMQICKAGLINLANKASMVKKWQEVLIRVLVKTNASAAPVNVADLNNYVLSGVTFTLS